MPGTVVTPPGAAATAADAAGALAGAAFCALTAAAPRAAAISNAPAPTNFLAPNFIALISN